MYTHSRTRSSFYILTALFLFLSLSLRAQQQEAVDSAGVIVITPEKEWDLFGRDRLVRLSLIYDGKLYRRRRYKPEYQKAILRIQLEDSSWVEKPVKIKARGEFRRNYCSYPPFKLNIKKADFDNPYLDRTGAMKFVTQCKDPRMYETLLLKEYLIYKIYNRLTKQSFRVRLVEMTYVDTTRKKRGVYTKYGFLIEPLKGLTKRLDAVRIESGAVGFTDIEPFCMARVALFEYMIGNTDWSLTGQHNVKVIKPLDIHHPQALVIPYDFDYSGLVDAPYAIPAENTGLESVRERLYRGPCLPDSITERAANLFLQRQDEMEQVIRKFPYLPEKEKKHMLSYLEDFFDILKDPVLRRNIIFSDCLPFHP